MHPHTQAILLALAATGAAGSILLLLLVAVWRRRGQGRAVPLAWHVATAFVGVVAACAAYLSFVFLGMTINGGSCERTVVEIDGAVRRIERRNMWGRSGMCFEWDEQRRLDLVETGYYSGDRKDGTIAFEADGVGFRDEHGKCGPWLFLAADGEPDPVRSGCYGKDKPALVDRPELFGLDVPAGSIRPLDQQDIDDLLLAWSSR